MPPNSREIPWPTRFSGRAYHRRDGLGRQRRAAAVVHPGRDGPLVVQAPRLKGLVAQCDRPGVADGRPPDRQHPPAGAYWSGAAITAPAGIVTLAFVPECR